MRKLEKIGLTILLLFSLTLSVMAQDSAAGQSYVVQANDTLYKIAEKYLGDGFLYPTIAEATNQKGAVDESFALIENVDLIEIGQKLWIPTTVEPSADPPSSAVPPVNQPVADSPLPGTTTGAPDGRIAFSFWNDEGNRCTYEINLIDVAACLEGPEACQANREIYPLNNVSEPALAPDGSRLAFRSWGEPPDAGSPYLNCAPAHPYRMVGHAELDGTLFVTVGGFWEDAHPDWSPDGNRLIFDTKRNGDNISRILVVGRDGFNEENMLIAGEQPSWGPDNQHFVYRGCDLSGNRCGLWLAAAYDPLSWNTGQNMLGPVVETDKAAHPDWSPVRDEIVYQKLEGDVWNLWLVNVDGSNDRPLLQSAGLAGLPVFSPDGAWIAYLANNGQTWQIRVINRDGSGDRNLFTYDGGLYHVPQPVAPYYQRYWIDEQISWGP